MAAAARPPGISDARVPCPLCGGLIHPVAGRCKHCKQDLTQLRTGRPQAAAPLPSLVAVAPAPSALQVPPRAQTPIPVAIPAHEASQPILPPRPTGRSMPAERPRSAWKSWPVMVIILAVLAIVTAVVILVWPQHDADDHRTLPPPPAPERMSTDPNAVTPTPAQPAPQGGADPWNNGTHGQITPPATPRSVPDPLPPDPPQDPNTDPFANPFGGGGVGGLGAQSPKLDFAMSAVAHVCDRVKACPAPDDDDDFISNVCDAYTMFPKNPSAAACAAGKRCIDKIDHMTCAQLRGDNPMVLISTVSECKDAITSC